MIKASHYSATGRKLKPIALPSAVFDGTVNEPAMHRAVVAYLASRRQGTHATKSRAQVAGGGRKAWRQKGTGRARQGSIRAPHWRGGGVAFGPEPREHRISVPKKLLRLARKSALNTRAGEQAIHVVEPLQLEAPKTKVIVQLLAKIGVSGKRVLVLTAGHNQNVYLSTRNVPRVDVQPYAEAMAYDILRAEHLIVEAGVLSGDAAAVKAAPAGAEEEK